MSKYIKQNIYKLSAITKDDMRERIREAYANVSPTMLKNVINFFQCKIYVNLQESGRHLVQILYHNNILLIE